MQKLRLHATTLATLATLATLMTGCGDDPTGPHDQTRTMTAVSPLEQTAIVGSEVRLAVVLHDRKGTPVAHTTVNFSGPTIDNRPFTRTVMTDGDGVAATSWILPSRPGTTTFQATAGRELAVQFTVHVEHGPPAALLAPIVDEFAALAVVQEYAAVAGETLDAGAIVVDARGNPVPGVMVSFSPDGATDGRVGNATAVTDASGLASSGGWTVGSEPGVYTLTARTADPGVPPLTLSARVIEPLAVTTIAAGEAASCAVVAQAGGATYCWGRGFSGSHLGDTLSGDAVPGRIPDVPRLVSLAVGSAHACGLTDDGTAYCWGNNGSGQTGAPADAAPKGSPHPVPSGGLRFTQLSAAHGFTCGLTSDQRAYCWGDNSVGQLGDGTTTSRETPAPVAGELAFRAIAAADGHACAITTEGAVHCWGRNDLGQLGAVSAELCETMDYDELEGWWYRARVSCSLRPLRAASAPALVALTGSFWHSCGLTATGGAFCWGGFVGQQSSWAAGAPEPLTQVVARGWELCGLGQSGEVYCGTAGRLRRLEQRVRFRAISAGVDHACGIARETDVAYCWGANHYGQLGVDGPLLTGRPRPVSRPLP
jgi:hypothetical protein